MIEIEIKITGTNAVETWEELRGLAKGISGENLSEEDTATKPTPDAPPEEPKAKSKSGGKKAPAKEELKEEAKPETKEAPKEAPKEEQAKSNGAEAPTVEELRALIQQKAQSDDGFKAKAKSYLGQVGAENLSGMTEEQRVQYARLLNQDSADDDDLL